MGVLCVVYECVFAWSVSVCCVCVVSMCCEYLYSVFVLCGMSGVCVCMCNMCVLCVCIECVCGGGVMWSLCVVYVLYTNVLCVVVCGVCRGGRIWWSLWQSSLCPSAQVRATGPRFVYTVF